VWQSRDQALSSSLLSFGLTCLTCLIHRNRLRPGLFHNRGEINFGTALAEAGVDLAVMQALLGHAHVDTTARYIHLTPTHVKAQYDAARTRQRDTL
jgi:integrase